MRKRVNEHFCDRCGKDFVKPRDVAMPIRTGGRNLQPAQYELCKGCADAFKNEFMTMDEAAHA